MPHDIEPPPAGDAPLGVLLVVPTFPPDQCGVGDYTYQLATHLHGQGHRVSVLSTWREGPRREHPFAFLPVLRSWHFPDMQALLDVVRERAPQVVHIQYHNEDYDSVEMISTLPLCLKETCPDVTVVTTLHNTRSFTFAPQLTMGVMLRFSDWLIITNDADREVLLREHPLHAHKVSVVPAAGGLPCDAALLARRGEHRAAVRRRLGVGDADLLLCYFGFINPEKGLESLLHGLGTLRRQGHGARLLLIGGLHSDREHAVSPYHQELLRLIADLGLEAAVTATGYLDAEAASQHLLAADLAVLPFRDGITTKRSSFLSVLGHGVPLLTTAGPHLPPALRHGENVWLVPAGEPATTGRALARAVRELDGDRARLASIRDGGRRLFDEIYAWEPITRTHVDLYRRARGSAHPSPAGAVAAKLKSLHDAAATARRLGAQGKTIVLAGGCFDILHVGHIRYLREARARGDCLFLALNSDRSVRALKGPDRPVIDERERAEILAEFSFVDYIVLFDEDTAEAVLAELQPHIYAKGTDYEDKPVPGTEAFLRRGGRLLFVGDEKRRSSSDYLRGRS
jgi:glycerol-3-phosphate cytidylyltransferase